MQAADYLQRSLENIEIQIWTCQHFGEFRQYFITNKLALSVIVSATKRH